MWNDVILLFNFNHVHNEVAGILNLFDFVYYFNSTYN